jgi:hypothetical protein
MSARRRTTAELLAMHAALRQLQADGTAQPWRLAYAAARNLRRLDAVAAAFEAARLALIDAHAERDADGPLVMDGPNVVLATPETFAITFRALQEQEEEIALHTVSAADMPGTMPVGLAAALLPMIEDGEAEA